MNMDRDGAEYKIKNVNCTLLCNATVVQIAKVFKGRQDGNVAEKLLR